MWLGRATLWTMCVLLLFTTTSGHTGHHDEWEGQKVENKLHDPRVVQDAEHIKEHLSESTAVNESAMTKEQLEFHYFKMHDLDNNTKLDGLEMLQAFTHTAPFDPAEEVKKAEYDNLGPDALQKHLDEKRDEWLRYHTDVIDTVLSDDDTDQDGYLSYAEFLWLRRRADKENEEKAAKK